MSYVFSVSGNESVLRNDYFPPIALDENSQYEIAFVSLETYNTIPNIEEDISDKFYFGDKIFVLNQGAYGVEDIAKYLHDKVSKENSNDYVRITANHNTLKCEIKSTKPIDFSKDNTFGHLLGYDRKILKANTLEIGHHPVDIMPINVIKLECSLVRGSFDNGKSSHTIYEFFPTVPAGYKIIETPSNLIYLPVENKTISNIELKLLDQNGKLVNFRGENISIRLHLRKRRN